MAATQQIRVEPLVIRTSRLKFLGAVTGGGLMMWGAASIGGPGWLLFWLLAPAVALCGLALVKRASVVLDEEGLTVRPLLSRQARLLWTDVEGRFEVVSRKWPLKEVAFSYKPDRRPEFWGIAVLPPYLTMSPRGFADLLNAYRDGALARLEQSAA